MKDSGIDEPSTPVAPVAPAQPIGPATRMYSDYYDRIRDDVEWTADGERVYVPLYGNSEFWSP